LGCLERRLNLITMFLGTSTLTLDSKGRIAIPARYRKQLEELCEGKVVISLNPLDKCLIIYPYGEWLECERKMDEVKDQSVQFRKYQRLIYSFTNDVEMDSSGRILIPQQSRSKVGLEKNVVLIGHGKKFELWSEESWLRVSEDDSEELVKSLGSRSERIDLGFTL